MMDYPLYKVVEIAEKTEQVYRQKTKKEWIAHRDFIDDLSFWKGHERHNKRLPKKYRKPYAIEIFDYEKDPNALYEPEARYPILRIEMRKYTDKDTYTVMRSADGIVENEPGKSLYGGTNCWTSAWKGLPS